MILSINILQKSFPGTEMREIPWLLSHLVKSPIFSTFAIEDHSRYVGNLLLFGMLLNHWYICATDVSMLTCNISALMLSVPWLFPLFSFIMAVLISSVSGPVSISYMVSISLTSQSSGS